MRHLLSPIIAVALFAAWSSIDADPALLNVSSQGTSYGGCSEWDGSAVNFAFQVADALPAAPDFAGPPIGNQELVVRVNSDLAHIRALRRWKIGRTDGSRELLAWVCPKNQFWNCDDATEGTVKFTRATESVIEGEWDLQMKSGKRVSGPFSATVTEKTRITCHPY